MELTILNLSIKYILKWQKNRSKSQDYLNLEQNELFAKFLIFLGI